MAKSKRIKTSIIRRPAFNLDSLLDFFCDEQTKENEKKFKGVTIAQYYKGKTLKNKFGECYKISAKIKIETIKPNPDRVKYKLLSDLKAIQGISNITESNLKREGINSVSDLTRHYRYGNNAAIYLNSVENKNALKIYKQLSSRFTSSSPLLLSNSALFDFSKIAFIDIETLGLTECPLFLIGIAIFKDNHLIIDQIFVRELKEEKPALHFLNELLKDKQAISTFNGKSFDVPFIRKRMDRHDLKHDIAHPHFDLKYFSQKAFKDKVSDFRLTTIEEQIFLTTREDDVSGFLIPYYYRSYLKSKNISLVVPIIDHNKQDLITTANIFMKLHELWS